MDALLPTLYFGRPIVAYNGRFSPELAFTLMQEHGVTHTFLFPTALKAMMKAYPEPRKEFRLKLQAIMSAGEAVGDAVFAYCREHGLRPYIGVFEPGHVRHVGAYLDKGWIEPPIALKVSFSDFAPFGLPPRAEFAGMYGEIIEMVLPGVPVEWFVTCWGPSIWELAPATMSFGRTSTA